MNTTTRRLAASAKENAAVGFAALHARVARHLVAWAALHVTPPLRRWVPLEDFVQEVWARAFAAFASYDPSRGTFRGWLLGIAYNVLRENLRTGRRRHTVPAVPTSGPVAVEQLADSITSVTGRLARDEAMAVVIAKLDALDDADRQLVAWRAIEELPYDEIGRRLGLTRVAAESRWRRLAERLHEQLAAFAAGGPQHPRHPVCGDPPSRNSDASRRP